MCRGSEDYGRRVGWSGPRRHARAGRRDGGTGAVAASVERLVLVSGIVADLESRSSYIRARTRRTGGPAGVSKRYHRLPGAMFGRGDTLFGSLAEFGRLLPVVPAAAASARRA